MKTKAAGSRPSNRLTIKILQALLEGRHVSFCGETYALNKRNVLLFKADVDHEDGERESWVRVDLSLTNFLDMCAQVTKDDISGIDPDVIRSLN